jgi:DNA-binding transcriptional LysR family regulator
VRLIESVPEDMVAVRFGGDARFVAVAAPRYLEKHGSPRVPADLAKHECIRHRMRSGKIYRWELERRGREVIVDVPGALTLDDVSLMADAASAGLGIAFVPEQAAADAIRAGKVEIVLGDRCPRIGGFALYYLGRRRVPRVLRAFIDVMRECEGRAEAR